MSQANIVMKSLQLLFIFFFLLPLHASTVRASPQDFLPSHIQQVPNLVGNSPNDQRQLTEKFTDPTEREFIKVLVEKNFHGEWSFVNSSLPLKSVTFIFFENQGGILKASNTKIGHDEYLLELMFVDGSNSDKKFVLLSFRCSVFAQTLVKETSSFQLINYPITYRKGDNFFTFAGFADKIDPLFLNLSLECTLNNFTITFWNEEENRPFRIFKDKTLNLQIKIDLRSDDCGFGAQGSLEQNYGRKFNLQIWLYVSLVALCILSQLIVFIIQIKTPNLYLSLAHRFQISFIMTMNIQFVRINLMFFGEYLFDFSRAWVFLLIAMAFFLIFALEIRLLFQAEGQGYLSYSWGPFAGIGLFICFLMFSSDYYWILYPYIMTPVMDVLQSYTSSRRSSYSFFFYLGYLLPYLPLIGYFKWYQDNFAKFSPTPRLVPWCSFFIFLGLTWLFVRLAIKKLYPGPEDPRFKVIESYEGETQDCAICLERLEASKAENINNEAKVKEIDNVEASSCGHVENQYKSISSDQILQTPCNHMFHQKCLEKWIQIKLVCPLCGRKTPDSIISN